MLDHAHAEEPQIVMRSSNESTANSTKDSTAPPSNLLGALLALIAARADLIRLESKEVLHELTTKIILTLVVALSLLFGWALLLVSVIVWCVSTHSWQWYWVTGGCALGHLLVGIICLVLLRRRSQEWFVTTREEFTKDRQWLESLHQKKN